MLVCVFTLKYNVYIYYMSSKIFYAYIILGLLFVAVSIYILIKGNTNGYAIIYDPVIALLLFYRAYRVYKTKQDQELM